MGISFVSGKINFMSEKKIKKKIFIVILYVVCFKGFCIVIRKYYIIVF